MNIRANQPLYLPLLGAGSAVLLLSGIAIASMAISAQGFSDVAASVAPREEVSALAETSRCTECGVIESARKIEAPDEMIVGLAAGLAAAGKPAATNARPSGSYAITIRLRDGSMRVITDAHPAKWRPGERVTLIAGMEQPAR